MRDIVTVRVLSPQLSSSADALFPQNKSKVSKHPWNRAQSIFPHMRCDILPSVVVRRSFGEQYASEASWGSELPQESSVGILGVHSSHHHPGHCRLQWVLPFISPLSGRKWCFLHSEKEMKKTVQSGSAAGCSGLRLKDRFVNYCGRLLIWVTPNSLIKQRPAWGTSGECVQGVQRAQIRSDPPAAWFYFTVWMFQPGNDSSWFHCVESEVCRLSAFHSQVENLCNQIRLFPVTCKVQRPVCVCDCTDREVGRGVFLLLLLFMSLSLSELQKGTEWWMRGLTGSHMRPILQRPTGCSRVKYLPRKWNFSLHDWIGSHVHCLTWAFGTKFVKSQDTFLIFTPCFF